VYSVSSDGMLRILNVQNGAIAGQAYAFVPANSRAGGLMVVDGFAYATTEGSCGGEDGVWMVDTHTGERAKWTTSGGIAGPAVMGPDGMLYVATRNDGLVALEPQTLKRKAVYEGGFTASPVLFRHQEKTLLAAAGKDGSIHLVDAATMSAAGAKPAPAGAVTSLSSWEDRAGVRWMLSTTADAVVAWKVEDRGGQMVERAWTSRAAGGVRPLIMNDVVFVGSGKTPLLQAIEGATGKELWNSGRAITAASPATALSGGGGQVYLSTYEGMLYAFGFPMEH
jgi:outer membrane protein assembly factor BamB